MISQKDSNSTDLVLGVYKKFSFFHFKCYNLVIYKLEVFEKFLTGESTLHPLYFPPKKKYIKVLILYFFWNFFFYHDF
jgi:hypothetical protein